MFYATKQNKAAPTQTPQNTETAPIDRLAHAKIHANELSNSRLRKSKSRWTPEKRAEKAEIAKSHQPWRKSTGPKTAAGKKITCLNAYKDGRRARSRIRLRQTMRAQSWFLKWALAESAVQMAALDNLRGAAVMIQPRLMKLDEILAKTRRAFEAAGIDTAALDARILVREGARLTDAEIISGGQTPIGAQQIEIIDKFAKRRLEGEPVSRILGGREFYGRMFKLSPDTLDPRPDTETLVEAALKPFHAKLERSAKNAKENINNNFAPFAPPSRPSRETPFKILDLGTGSGCILITLLAELPNATGVGVDINAGAVSISRENADRHGVAGRAEFRCGSWFDAVKDGEQFDLIVSNPPYIRDADIESLAVEVRGFDPILALSGGFDGLAPYKIILKDLKKYLACGGRALFEIGAGQEKDVARLAGDSMMTHTESYRDLGGILRVLEITSGEK